jgi:hypothetical protein
LQKYSNTMEFVVETKATTKYRFTLMHY